MRTLVQRTKEAQLFIDGRLHCETGCGLLVLFGTRTGDSEVSCNYLADKLVNLRIFEDDDGKMNRSALDVGAEIMIVSQFTLYADTRKGRRPAFTDAMEPVEAERLYKTFTERVGASGLTVQTGVFGAIMDIKLTNHGPVTILLEHEA
ncbi:MAG: D-tyrosyl-tRNA(Tyr) deacylase [candidate division Zixibacteria bacterium]|nr:D-tyrosyl-tRNA(Tyr) deacylase [candidate division Zixibacteria bacterium]